jgi:hypothetical protein
MDGQVQPYDGMFITGSGARLRYPGDPDGEASEIIGCRCYRSFSINHYAGLT